MADRTAQRSRSLCPHGETIPFLVPNDIWEFVVGAYDAGVICPECFTRRAKEKGLETFCRIEAWTGCDCHLTKEEQALLTRFTQSHCEFERKYAEKVVRDFVFVNSSDKKADAMRFQNGSVSIEDARRMWELVVYQAAALSNLKKR